MFLAEAFVRPVLTLNPSSALAHFWRRFAGVFPRLTFPWCPNARNCQRVFRKRLDGEAAAAGLVVGRRVARLNGVNRQRPWPPGKHGWRLLAGGATVNARSACGSARLRTWREDVGVEAYSMKRLERDHAPVQPGFGGARIAAQIRAA
jgi:hypothetical protein